MPCVNVPGGTTCYPPYDSMYPTEEYVAEYGSMDITEDLICGSSTLLLWALGIGIGWLAAEKAVSYLGNK